MRAPAIALVLLLATPARAAPPVWVPDKAASKIAFASSFDGQGFTGSFKRWDANVRFDPKDLAHSSAVVTVDMASAVTGDPDRDAALPDPKWFSTAAYPKATFKATSFKALGGTRYQAAGALTIRGITKPLTLPFTLVITGDQARMDAKVALNRLAFGVGQDEWKSTQAIPAAVQVSIVVAAKRAK